MINNTAENKIYTYADYENYPENERIEIIEGHIYDMAPSPSRVHQEIISELITIINSHIKANKGPCKVYPAPFDVILAEDDNISNCKNVLQPDISIICDKGKLTDKGCIGSPDLIIEVVSPYNPNSDYVRKLNIYDQFKVKEYWIINPMNKTILVYRQDSNLQYAAPESYSFRDKIKVGIFNNLEIDFSGLELE